MRGGVLWPHAGGASQGHTGTLNDAEEKFLLAGCYARGDGPEQSWLRAVRWLTRAAEAGHPGAGEPPPHAWVSPSRVPPL